MKAPMVYVHIFAVMLLVTSCHQTKIRYEDGIRATDLPLPLQNKIDQTAQDFAQELLRSNGDTIGVSDIKKITTSPLHEELQQMVSTTIQRYHQDYQELDIGILIKENKTGKILSWNSTPIPNEPTKDQIVIERKIGTAIYPFITLAVLNQMGFHPCFLVIDKNITIHPGEGHFVLSDDWQSTNYHQKETLDTITLVEAIQTYNGNAPAFLLSNMGTTQSILQSLGLPIKEEYPYNHPSIAAGNLKMSLFQLVELYATMANEGLWVTPRLINSVEDNAGNIHQVDHQEKLRFGPSSAKVMLQILKGMHQETLQYLIPFEVCGYAGINYFSTHGFFLAMSPELTIGVTTSHPDHTYEGIKYAQIAEQLSQDLLLKIVDSKELNFHKDHSTFSPPSEDVLNCAAYQSAVPAFD